MRFKVIDEWLGFCPSPKTDRLELLRERRYAVVASLESDVNDTTPGGFILAIIYRDTLDRMADTELYAYLTCLREIERYRDVIARRGGEYAVQDEKERT